MNSDIIGAIWTVASVITGALVSVGSIMWPAGYRRSAWFCFMLSRLPMIVSTLIWAPMASNTIWKFAVPGTVGAISGAVILIAATQILAAGANLQMPTNTPPPSDPNHTAEPHFTIPSGKNSVIGEEIVGNGQGGVAKEIISNGAIGGPSVGQELNVNGQSGQNITGMRVIQTGPGTGLRVIQNGPGTGLKVTVGSKPE